MSNTLTTTKVTVSQDELAAAVSACTKLIKTSGGTPDPHIAVIGMKAADGVMTLYAATHDAATRQTIPCEGDLAPVMVNYTLASEVIDRGKADTAELSVVNDRLVYMCGRNPATMATMTEEMIRLPDMTDADEVTIPRRTFVTIMTDAAMSASTDTARGPLTGIKVEATDGVLHAWSTDSHRLARLSTPLSGGTDMRPALLPAKIVSTMILKSIPDDADSITIATNGNIASFAANGSTTTVRLVAGEFPAVGPLLTLEGEPGYEDVPESHQLKVATIVTVTDVGGLEEEISAILPYVRRSSQQQMIICDFSAEGSALKTAGTEAGEIEPAIDVSTHGPDVTIGFNHQYLTDIMQAIGGSFDLCIQDGATRCLIEPRESDDITRRFVLMPMRLS